MLLHKIIPAPELKSAKVLLVLSIMYHVDSRGGVERIVKT
jgi:hypothetical protein